MCNEGSEDRVSYSLDELPFISPDFCSSFHHAFCYPDPAQLYFAKGIQFPKLKSIAQQQLTTLNAKSAYYTYIGIGFLPSDHQFLPPSPSFKTYITQVPFLDCALMCISPLVICIVSSSLPPIILDSIKEYL
jgi:hypothetical protein